MLSGIRIVEIEGIGPGPFAGMLLADLGADVILVQRREHAPTPGIPEHNLLHRGKRSLALDLKQEDDRTQLRALLTTADGLIEGFRPGVMERLGLGPDECLRLNPKLVYGRLTGWGQEGPFAQRAGHDMNFVALSGALSLASPPGVPPVSPPTLAGDVGGGSLYLVIGLLSGILQARQTGQGTVVDAAILDGSSHMLNLLLSLQVNGQFTLERGKSLLDGPHWSRTYQTADGRFMCVQCLEPKFYQLFLETLGLAEDEEFQHQFRESLWPRLSDRLAELFATRPRKDWEELFAGLDACVMPVLSPEEAAQHPQNQARGTWVTAHGFQQTARAPRFSNAPEWTPRLIPDRGQHQEEILAEIPTRLHGPAK